MYVRLVQLVWHCNGTKRPRQGMDFVVFIVTGVVVLILVWKQWPPLSEYPLLHERQSPSFERKAGDLQLLQLVLFPVEHGYFTWHFLSLILYPVLHEAHWLLTDRNATSVHVLHFESVPVKQENMLALALTVATFVASRCWSNAKRIARAKACTFITVLRPACNF